MKAQGKSSPILFFYDASGSMWGEMNGKTKKEIAADVLSTAVKNLPDNQEVGLMAYGHRRKSDCDDVELILGLTNSSKEKVINAIKGIIRLGEPLWQGQQKWLLILCGRQKPKPPLY